MNAALEQYLNDPIPRKTVLIGVGVMAAGHAMSFIGHEMQVRALRKARDHDALKIKVLKESYDFLLDNANDRTVAELNEKQQYWRQILGMEPTPWQPGDDESPEA